MLAHDPYVPVATAHALGVELTTLEGVFAESDVVSLHAPLLDETRAMVDARLLRSMRPDATLVNTARGGLIDEPALVTVLGERPDLFAVLDVTDPEPPPPGSPLFDLDNVVVTPHLAGSLGPERRLLGRAMAEELARYVAGQPAAPRGGRRVDGARRMSTAAFTLVMVPPLSAEARILARQARRGRTGDRGALPPGPSRTSTPRWSAPMPRTAHSRPNSSAQPTGCAGCKLLRPALLPASTTPRSYVIRSR